MTRRERDLFGEINTAFERWICDRWQTCFWKTHTDLPFCSMHDKLSVKRLDKLLVILYDKKRYVIHYRNLQQCTHHGIISISQRFTAYCIRTISRKIYTNWWTRYLIKSLRTRAITLTYDS